MNERKVKKLRREIERLKAENEDLKKRTGAQKSETVPIFDPPPTHQLERKHVQFMEEMKPDTYSRLTQNGRFCEYIMSELLKSQQFVERFSDHVRVTVEYVDSPKKAERVVKILVDVTFY